MEKEERRVQDGDEKAATRETATRKRERKRESERERE